MDGLKTVELRVSSRATRDVGKFYRDIPCNMRIEVLGKLDNEIVAICLDGPQALLLGTEIGQLGIFLKAAGVPGTWTYADKSDRDSMVEGTRLNMIVLNLHLVDVAEPNDEQRSHMMPPALERGHDPVNIIVDPVFYELNWGNIGALVVDYNLAKSGKRLTQDVRKGTPGLNPRTGLFHISSIGADLGDAPAEEGGSGTSG